MHLQNSFDVVSRIGKLNCFLPVQTFGKLEIFSVVDVNTTLLILLLNLFGTDSY